MASYTYLSTWLIPKNGYYSVHRHLGLDASIQIRVINNDSAVFFAVESATMPLNHDASMIVHSSTHSQYSITSTADETKDLWIANKGSRQARVALFQVVDDE